MSKKTSFEAEVKKFEKDKFLHRGGEFDGIKGTRIPTGVFTLDMYLDGGIAQHKLNVFFGKPGSGKSTTAYSTIGQYLALFQKQHVLLADFELSYDGPWVEKFVAKDDMSRLHVLQPDYGEQGVDIAEALVASSDDVGLIVVDSIGGIVSVGQTEKKADEDQRPGSLSRLVNTFLRKLVPIVTMRRRLGMHPLTLLCINQIRAKIGGFGFIDYELPGGWMLKHNSAITVEFKKEGYLKHGNVPYLGKHKFSINKNKTGGIEQVNENFFVYVHDANKKKIGTFEETEQIVFYGIKCGIIERSGSGWKIGKTPFRSKDEIKAHIQKNRNDFHKLRSTVLQKCIETRAWAGEGGDEDVS